MNWLDLLNPLEIIKFIGNAYRSWRGFRLVVFGTTESGKTTFWRYLETNRIVNVEDVKKTWKVESKEMFRLQKINLSFINVGVLATDLPGDPEFRDTWEKVLVEVKPQGIIFLLDNVADTSKIPTLGYDPKRLVEHKIAFEHLVELLVKHKEVSKELKAMAIVVNKSDSFPRDLTYGRLLKETGISTTINQYVELHKCKSTSTDCSAIHGSNVKEIMRWLVDEMKY